MNNLFYYVGFVICVSIIYSLATIGLAEFFFCNDPTIDKNTYVPWVSWMFGLIYFLILGLYVTIRM